MKRIKSALSALLLVASAASLAQEGDWEPVTGAENLRDFMSGRTIAWQEDGGDRSRGEYRADGTGTVYSWGASFPRKWEIKGDDQVCITGDPANVCYKLEKNSANPKLYRSIDVATGAVVEIRITDTGEGAVVAGDAKSQSKEGGPAAASVTELARELSNPNSALASLNFKNQFRWFEGDLPNANNQSSYTLLFQPVLPFPLEKKGTSILWRPAIPLFANQPVFNASSQDFDKEFALGDIAMDLAYSKTSESGLLTAYGLFTVLPTATSSDVGSGRWSIGPEFLLAKKDKEYIVGIFPNHLWDVAGWSDKSINKTSIKLIANSIRSGGWVFGTNPLLAYDWESDQWTIPINLTVSKTVVSSSGRPWKLALELDYFVEKADVFGPEFLVSLNVTPVVKNGLADLFKKKQ